MTSRRNPEYGPRVSISSFGPIIVHPKCGYCTQNASIPCTTCNATWYCTLLCQEVDRPVHGMICQIYTDFVTANPCPNDTVDKKYRLGLLLPVDSATLKLAWIANGSRGKSVACFLQYYDQERINTRKTLMDCNMTSRQFDHSIILAVRGDFLTDNSLPNVCINHLMDGKLKYSLKGPVAVVSESGHGPFGNAQHFQPCDLRILIDFLSKYEGKPQIEIGHACGVRPKGVLGTSVNRLLKFLKGKAQDGKAKSTNTLFDVEEHRTYRTQSNSFTEPDWVMDSKSFLPRHRVQYSQSSINLGSVREDASSLHEPESFVLPDFLPDWIRESVSITTGPLSRSQTAPVNGPSDNKKKTIRPSASMDSMKITPIIQDGNQIDNNRVYQNENVIIRNSIDFFNRYNSSTPMSIGSAAASIISARPSPSVITTTSLFQPRPIRKVEGRLKIDRKSSFFNRPETSHIELVRQPSIVGSIMSPWMV